MDEVQFISLVTSSISNFGFPIVLTGYLLTRFEKRIDTLNASIIELVRVIKEEVRQKDD
ncbi:YvrJ family protein [Paenibacillus periandrae]|uniref:YvrJ family protein n=1 Tax=Paenibacillus periandrae TaxID=1761741 RepID=UPI001F08AB28